MRTQLLQTQFKCKLDYCPDHAVRRVIVSYLQEVIKKSDALRSASLTTRLFIQARNHQSGYFMECAHRNARLLAARIPGRQNGETASGTKLVAKGRWLQIRMP
jgi:hypothetical protein